MSFPAARMGDLTAHGGTITVGTPTTLIGSMPASRIGDLHTCPMVNVLVPHVGGPIVLGAFNVLVGGPPQARITDMCTCAGPPALVTLGEETVLVGMAGAFEGALGGFLSLVAGAFAAGASALDGGFPFAVSFPADAANPAGYFTQYSKAVEIHGTPDFQSKALDRLAAVSSTASGRAVLDRIDGSGHTLTISESNGPTCLCGPTGVTPAAPSPVPMPYPNQGAGGGEPGADTTLQHNPDLSLPNSLAPDNPMPNDAVMFNGLDHASHQTTGRQEDSAAGSPGEATYLAERGYPYHRTDDGLGWAAS